MELAQNRQTFIQPSPSRLRMPPSFVDDTNSPAAWTLDLHAESKRSSASSPLPSPSIPSDVYRHLRELRNCEAINLEIGLSLARERKFEHIMALKDYKPTDVLRWHSSLSLYDGELYNSIFPPSTCRLIIALQTKKSLQVNCCFAALLLGPLPRCAILLPRAGRLHPMHDRR